MLLDSIMGRELESAQNMVCEADVFGVVIKTQIQDSSHTNSYYGSEIGMFQRGKIFSHSCAPTELWRMLQLSAK